ncbi:MAG TPA: carboxypeptidase regulatory-like domain-containing protein [Candidatus Dormibacteraeota bacterium]|nr:carboxypeptidase regulatory-like domain-containing protein [Candidatus Dormibacteraeota bacterium]
MARFRGAVRLAGLLPLLTACVLPARADGSQRQPPAQNSNVATSGASVPQGFFRIAGTVVNAKTGEALARAQVSLADTRNRAAMINVVTGSDGRFEFTGLGAAKYSLNGSKRGFLSAGYEQHEVFSTAIVTGPNFATDKLELRLTPTALISGHVYDESGEGIRRGRVHLYRETRFMGAVNVSGGGTAITDDRGYYEFASLRPGNYYVAADAKPWYATRGMQRTSRTPRDEPGINSGIAEGLDVAYPTTYYGGATEADGAAASAVSGGDQVQLDIHLNPVAALHVLFRGQTTPGASPNFRPPSFIKRGLGSTVTVATEEVQSRPDGTLEVSGLAPGRYTVRYGNREDGAMQQSEDVDLGRNGQEFDDLRGTALGSVKVNWKMLGGEPLPGAFSATLSGPNQRPVDFGQGGSGNDTTLVDVVPGNYTLQVFGGEKNYCVMRITSASGTTEGHDITIGPGAEQEVTAYVAAGNVTVEGGVQKNGKSVAGVMVALIPRDPEHHLEMFRRDQSDFDGTFSMGSVVPGTYTLVAIEDAWGFEWMKPGVLARYVAHGQTVTIGELMRGSVKLPDAEEVHPR